MNLNFPIENLPFSLQKYILDYKPKLPKLEQISLLRKHFNKRYCPRCGEYMDFIQKRQYSDFPKHLHRGRAKYNGRYKYKCFYPNIFLNLTSLKQNSLSLSIYNTIHRNDETIPIKIFCRIHSPQYFYNMRLFLQKKTKYILQMVNLFNINLFKNTECYISINYPSHAEFLNHQTFFWDHYREYDDYMSDNHLKKIYNILFQFMYYIPNLWFDMNHILICNKKILRLFLQTKPHMTLFSLLSNKLIPDIIYYFIIYEDITLLEYLPERKLKTLYNNNTTFFTNLLNDFPIAKNYIHLYDPVLDTLEDRLFYFIEVEEEDHLV